MTTESLAPADIRARLAELAAEDWTRDPSSPLGWRLDYSRARELEAVRLRAELARLEPDAPDVARDRAVWARDADV